MHELRHGPEPDDDKYVSTPGDAEHPHDLSLRHLGTEDTVTPAAAANKELLLPKGLGYGTTGSEVVLSLDDGDESEGSSTDASYKDQVKQPGESPSYSHQE